MQVADRVFLITGGASGLGATVAEHLVEQGAKVVLADIGREAGEAKAAELGEAARFVATDVTNAEQAQAAVQRAVGDFGRLDGLVSCAGVAPGERVVGRQGPHSLELFNRVININLVGTFNVLRLAADVISRNEPGEDGERGVIVNTASVAAFDGQIGQAAYAASKAGVAGLTLPVARELARFGIRVVTIAPGIFETPMMAAMTEEVRASLGATVPFPARLGKPVEFAGLVQHIIENRYLNGEVIRLDGALRMAAK
ncbi:3-hydroxyacyl-CoA dehydrogenase [Pseudochelatococcus contaminans]|uniref:NAD(P)-dependent dehydrogenase (Short-subunit alcohol dehydrogenase family) n=1 Tax=Pseudochelatococcus contaminans TaxID=1538103 RepID=A0A7W5Z3D8_9HYPH|nr:3-hydroxyacyl-CoA dehydrogenase [Pseudochelatococcus contaminans]MBB3809395.1 NAD(P)-dependent dehydrogenase (short-subunit alcohol dehydrogenase family) [Pseudochelatococcus contaminans]